MAETKRREGGADAGWNLPTKHLPPPLGSRDLPDPLPLRKIVGASVIILATALGSGELILWPYVVTQVGIGILWLLRQASPCSSSSTWRSNATPLQQAKLPSLGSPASGSPGG